MGGGSLQGRAQFESCYNKLFKCRCRFPSAFVRNKDLAVRRELVEVYVNYNDRVKLHEIL